MSKVTVSAAGGAMPTFGRLIVDHLKEIADPARHTQPASEVLTAPVGGAVAAGTTTRGAPFSFPPPLSTLIRDPFVRRAFERAEREDGTAPVITVQEPRKPLLGGAEARREVENA